MILQDIMADQTRLKRLLYRSWHRGCKETDIVLGNFAERHLQALAPEMLDTYEALLEENDWDIWGWITGEDAPEPYGNLLNHIKSTNHSSLRGGSANEAIQ